MAASQPSTDEKRHYHRFASVKQAQILDPAAKAPTEVKLSDFSPAGARLKLQEPHPVGETFDLVIHPADDISRKTVKCQLQWQRGRDLGVKFI